MILEKDDDDEAAKRRDLAPWAKAATTHLFLSRSFLFFYVKCLFLFQFHHFGALCNVYFPNFSYVFTILLTFLYILVT